jgi:hypothetical protein
LTARTPLTVSNTAPGRSDDNGTHSELPVTFTAGNNSRIATTSCASFERVMVDGVSPDEFTALREPNTRKATIAEVSDELSPSFTIQSSRELRRYDLKAGF